MPPTESGGAPAIEFRDVVKRFGDHTVLEDLNFTVSPGERVTLIGPSGSGKTTILRLIMTLESLTGGYIDIHGRPLTHEERGGRRVALPGKQVRETTKRIGMVFQHFNLFPNMTVIENLIEAPIHVLGMTKPAAVEKARGLLQKVGLSDKEDEHPSRLSGGQQQRVAIARALAMDPDILLLDDITMLIVTHEMQFARDVSQRVMMFDGGGILEEGPPEDIFTNPREERTRRFLSAVLD